MNKIFAVFFINFLIITFMVNAFSVDLDGIDSGDEWHDSVSYVLVNGESNCNINFGLVKVKFDNKNSAVFLCFMFIDPLLEQENVDCGLRFSVNGSSAFEISPVNSPLNSEIDNYSFDGSIYIDENNGATCEIRLGFKEYMPQNISCDVQFVDSLGEPSNHYYFELVNEGYSETTALSIAPTADNKDPYYNPSLLTEKTTQIKSTKAKTTKYKTERETTRQKKKKTTTISATTKFVVPDSPMIYTGRTKPAKTNLNDYTVLDNPAVTIYYYEKEVVVSLVPVTVYVTEKKTSATTSHNTVSSTESSTVSAESTNKNVLPSASLSDGAKFKKISIVSAVTAFAVIAACGVFCVKKK